MDLLPDFTQIGDLIFFIRMCYVTLAASAATIFILQGYKKRLQKSGKLTEEMSAEQKDAMLSKRGRIVAILVYGALYIANELVLKHTVAFDGMLWAGILTGGALTLGLSKGMYTAFRQWQKKKTVYEKLKFAQEKLNDLQRILKAGSGEESQAALVALQGRTGECGAQGPAEKAGAAHAQELFAAAQSEDASGPVEKAGEKTGRGAESPSAAGQKTDFVRAQDKLNALRQIMKERTGTDMLAALHQTLYKD